MTGDNRGFNTQTLIGKLRDAIRAIDEAPEGLREREALKLARNGLEAAIQHLSGTGTFGGSTGTGGEGP